MEEAPSNGHELIKSITQQIPEDQPATEELLEALKSETISDQAFQTIDTSDLLGKYLWISLEEGENRKERILTRVSAIRNNTLGLGPSYALHRTNKPGPQYHSGKKIEITPFSEDLSKGSITTAPFEVKYTDGGLKKPGNSKPIQILDIEYLQTEDIDPETVKALSEIKFPAKEIVPSIGDTLYEIHKTDDKSGVLVTIVQVDKINIAHNGKLEINGRDSERFTSDRATALKACSARYRSLAEESLAPNRGDLYAIVKIGNKESFRLPQKQEPKS